MNSNILYTEEPYCHTLSSKFTTTRCSNCFNTNKSVKLKLCTQCRVLKYCSTSCQRLAWKVHKEECKALKRVSPKVPSDSVMLLHRLLVLKKLGQDSVEHDTKFGKRSFKDLMSHQDEIKCDPKRSQDFMEVVHTLKLYLGDDAIYPESTELLDVFGKMCINSFTICDGEMQALGVGIYLGGSKLDHSCRPTAVVTFDGTKLQVSAEKKYTPEQLMISYIEQMSTLEERQTQLQKQYYFTCDCQACQDRQMNCEMLSTVCPSLNCDGLIVEDKGEFVGCTKCGLNKQDKDYKQQKARVTEKYKTELVEMEALTKQGDYKGILSRCQSRLLSQESLLSAVNVYQVRVLDKAFDACIELNLWEKALVYGLDTMQAYRKYYGTQHPLTGVQAMKLGKIQLYLQQLEAAMAHLQQAESVLSCTHGRHHNLYRQLLTLLDQCAEERRLHMEQTQH